MKVGFIGLGLMGNPMAKNLNKAKLLTGVYNRDKQKTQEFKNMGITIYDNPKDLAKKSDVIITMVTGPKDVEEVLFGKSGVADAGKKLVVIDMSTIGLKAAKKIAKELADKGIDFIDAPVTGSVPKAITGELTIFIGGKRKVFEKVIPVLSAMGTNLQYIGSSGKGQAVKLINNLLVASTLTALAEGMLLSDVLDVNREVTQKALGDAPVISPVMKIKMDNMAKNDFTTAFSMINMHKDLKLALEELNKKKLPMLKLVESLYKKGINQGLSNSDNSAVIKVLAEEF